MSTNDPQNETLFNYLVRSITYPFGRQVLSPQPKTIEDLNAYCLGHVFRHLTFRELVQLRAVSRHFRDAIDEFHETRSSFTYDCQLNGREMSNGHYRFNQRAFEAALSRMPMLVSLRFERCHLIKNILATCPINILSVISEHLPQLHELHMTRCVSVTSESLRDFGKALPQLTHLSIELFNEKQLASILDSFPNLQYLNLTNSVLYAIGGILESKLHSNIRTLILPKDLRNEKQSLIEALGNGHGRNLRRLEIPITICDFVSDRKFFQDVATLLPNLEWLQFELRYTGQTQILNCSANSNAADHSDDSGVQSPTNDFHASLHASLLQGLSKLELLRVLILIECDFSVNVRMCSLLTDDSLAPIIRNCSQLQMLSVSCGLNRTEANYKPRKGYSKAESRIINNILHKIAQDEAKPKEKAAKMNRQESILTESDEDDSASYNSVETLPHRVGDGSLGLLDHHVPKLRILHVRGVRMGPRTMRAINALPLLEHLRIDSVTFSSQECSRYFADFLNHIESGPRRTNIRITNVSLS